MNLELTETIARPKLTYCRSLPVVSQNAMNRIVSSLLIPLMLVSQSFCAAHSHVGTSVVEPDGHSATLHFHWDITAHHDDHDDEGHEWHLESEAVDSHDDCSLAIIEEHPVDHDSDAIYVSNSPLFNDSTSAKVDVLKLSNGCTFCDAFVPEAGLDLRIEGGLPPPLRDLSCPLYLRILSIRI